VNRSRSLSRFEIRRERIARPASAGKKFALRECRVRADEIMRRGLGGLAETARRHESGRASVAPEAAEEGAAVSWRARRCDHGRCAINLVWKSSLAHDFLHERAQAVVRRLVFATMPRWPPVGEADAAPVA